MAILLNAEPDFMIRSLMSWTLKDHNLIQKEIAHIVKTHSCTFSQYLELLCPARLVKINMTLMTNIKEGMLGTFNNWGFA